MDVTAEGMTRTVVRLLKAEILRLDREDPLGGDTRITIAEGDYVLPMSPLRLVRRVAPGIAGELTDADCARLVERALDELANFA